jgi:hypothetical protein
MKLEVILVLLLAGCICFPVFSESSGTDSSQVPDWQEGYFPTYPLDPAITWKGNLTLEAGYPLVDHTFGPFTEADWAAYDSAQDHTIRVIAYEHPPLFPNDTVYALYHENLETMPWLIEMKNPVTGDEMLAQVASTGKGVYNPNLSPLENDQQNNIGWYVVDGTLYPRTWISGHLKEGQTWKEFWGPFSPDKNGSKLRERTYQISEKEVTFAGKSYPGYIVTITGPHVIGGVAVTSTEELTLVDGIGVISRVLYHTASEPFVRNSSITGKQTMPEGTMIFRHVVTMYSMDK